MNRKLLAPSLVYSCRAISKRHISEDTQRTASTERRYCSAISKGRRINPLHFGLRVQQLVYTVLLHSVTSKEENTKAVAKRSFSELVNLTRYNLKKITQRYAGLKGRQNGSFFQARNSSRWGKWSSLRGRWILYKCLYGVRVTTACSIRSWHNIVCLLESACTVLLLDGAAEASEVAATLATWVRRNVLQDRSTLFYFVICRGRTSSGIAASALII